MKKTHLTFLGIELLFLIILLFVPSSLFAAETVTLTNPLGFINVDDPGKLIEVAFKGFVGLIAAIALAFTVFSGFKLIIATNEEAVKTARESLKWSVGGFVVALLTFTIIAGVGQFLGFEPGLLTNRDTIVNPITGPEKPGDFVSVLIFVMKNFLGIIGFVTTLMIIYYGYRYLTSAGNEEAVEQAKTGLKWSLLGFIVVLLAYTLINGVQLILLKGAG